LAKLQRRVDVSPKVQVYEGNLYLTAPRGKEVHLSTPEGLTITSTQIKETLAELSINVTNVATTVAKDFASLPDQFADMSNQIDIIVQQTGQNNTKLKSEITAALNAQEQSVTTILLSATKNQTTSNNAMKAEISTSNKDLKAKILKLETKLAKSEACGEKGFLFDGKSCYAGSFTSKTLPNCTTATLGMYRSNTDSKSKKTVIEFCVEPPKWSNGLSQPASGSKGDPALSCKQLKIDGFASGNYFVKFGNAVAEVYCQQDIDGGGWTLALNIHNNDAHDSSWAAKNPGYKQNGRNQVNPNKQTYWLKDMNYVPQGHKVPFGKDYKNQAVWKSFTANEMMVVRADPKKKTGEPTAYKVFEMLSKYQQPLLKTMQTTFRTKITGDSKKSWSANGQSATNYRCPLMRYSGYLLANFYYGNNGCRLVMSGHPKGLSAQSQNDDRTHGWGMDYSTYEGNRRLSGSSGHWNFDTSVAECNREVGNNKCGMGKDHSSSLVDYIDYGQYGFYVR